MNPCSRECIREDLPEAIPILERISEICALGEERHKDLGPSLLGLIHPSDLLTAEEKGELHELKLSLRPKSAQEAREDILRKRGEKRKVTIS